MTQWKTMDTAPRDGTHVLLAIDGKAIEGWWEKDKGNWDEETDSQPGGWDVVSLNSHGCGCCSWDNPEPTGWMELPA